MTRYFVKFHIPARIIIFSWLIPFFIKGIRKELNEDDMYRCGKKHDSKYLGDQLQTAWYKEKEKNSSFFKIFSKIFGTECIVLYIIAFGIDGVR